MMTSSVTRFRHLQVLLKEEKDAHSTQPVHLSGPLHQPRNLLFLIRHIADPAPQSLGSVVYLWRKASSNGNPSAARFCYFACEFAATSKAAIVVQPSRAGHGS